MEDEERSQTGSARSYNPYRHRNTPHPTSYSETLFHIIKGLFGSAIFAMPGAFANSGWLNGIISTIAICAFVVYCLNMVIKGKTLLCKRHKNPDLPFSESIKLAIQDGPDCIKSFSGSSGYIYNTIIITYQIGSCCVYILFIGKNVKQLFDAHIEKNFDLKIWILISSIPLLVFSVLFDSLKNLTPASIVGDVFSFLGIILVLYYLVTDLPPFNERDLVAPIQRYPLFLGYMFFATDAFGIAIISERNMKKPELFLGFLGAFSVGMAIFAILLIIVGFCGYWKYGEDSLGSVTLNIPQDEIFAQAIRIIAVLSIYLSYPLELFVPVSIIWDEYLKKINKYPRFELTFEKMLRLLLAVLSIVLAISIPQLGLVTSFLGSFCLPSLAFLYPAILDICVHWPSNHGPYKVNFIKDILIIIVSFIAMISGTIVSIQDLVKVIKQSNTQN